MKIMLVDDEFLVRLGIKSLIDWERHGFTYAGDAQDGREALALIGEVKPDIVLTDIVMPRMDGIELIGHVKRDYPHIHMIVLSSHTDYDYVRQAMKLGVEDYILKASLKPEELVDMLAGVAAKIRAVSGLPGSGGSIGRRGSASAVQSGRRRYGQRRRYPGRAPAAGFGSAGVRSRSGSRGTAPGRLRRRNGKRRGGGRSSGGAARRERRRPERAACGGL
ncbi:response regulator [Paenibacillus sp. 1P03SA]|uniref:response regulator n=1 Tax=Paenibacillus sp. 1P03SA TaxID=3132294 RepID=UPI0039A25773